MSGTSVTKVSSEASKAGPDGQLQLASGKRVAMRMWRNEEPQAKDPVRREYETVGYVLSGRAELTLDGHTVRLEAGDSWLVPAGAEHTYKIIEMFTAVEATSPPAQLHGRDKG